MADRTIARRYARAFLDIAEERGVTERLLADMVAVGSALRANDRELYRSLANPAFSLVERRAVLNSVLSRIGVDELTRNLSMLLLDKSRFALMHGIADVFLQMADERAGRVRVAVASASELSSELQGDIRRVMERSTGKSVILETQVNPDLIGGLVVRVGGRVYDASVRGRLDTLRQHLLRTGELGPLTVNPPANA